MIYSFENGKLVPQTREGKGKLEIGRVLRLNGYSNPEYVITGGLTEHDQYPVIQRETFQMSRKEMFTLKFLSEKKDDRIQLYITDEIADPFEVADLIRQASEVFKREMEEKEKAIAERERLIEIGRKIAQEKIPVSTQALIVAVFREDESDTMTDYFSSRAVKEIVLAVSNNIRDNFSEMRKAATKFFETKHLAQENPEWEHREKYSGGARILFI